MSSAETPNTNSKKLVLSNSFNNSDSDGHHDDLGYHGSASESEDSVLRQLEQMKQEINQLKCEKLDLLRQNVASQKELKRLREREGRLTDGLNNAQNEVDRLKVIVLDVSPEATV